MSGKHGPLVGAVDQGTSSSRFLIFSSKTAELLTYHQKETKQIYLKEGWVEQDPIEILNSVKECMEQAADNLHGLGISPADVKAIGITNQRETTVVWDKLTGKPLANAIIWLDVRTSSTVDKLLKTVNQDKDYLRPYCGLPLSTYFSAVKLRWLIDNSESVRKAVDENRCLFGTIDSWLLWNLTGGVNGGKHLTDVTNASRTMLLNIHTLQWDPFLCRFFDIKPDLLPDIRSSSEIYGQLVDGVFKDLPISGILGDQQAALVGQLCFKQGQAKNTYGTGCFLLYNTGTQPVESKMGLLTTIGYQLGKNKPVVYALEGSIAIAGACVQWLRDNLGVIDSSPEIEGLASSVQTSGGCCFVPAFSGLFCPYWQPDARGIICGLSQFTNKAHIARAALEAVCFQTRELLEAMDKDSGIPLTSLQVDGGMTNNNLLMQLQTDLLGIQVVRPSMPETTALGAAMAAGSAEGVDVWDITSQSGETITTDVFHPSVSATERDRRFSKWKSAVQRSMHWAEAEQEDPTVWRDAHWRTLAGGLYVWTSFGLIILAHLLHKHR